MDWWFDVVNLYWPTQPDNPSVITVASVFGFSVLCSLVFVLDKGFDILSPNVMHCEIFGNMAVHSWYHLDCSLPLSESKEILEVCKNLSLKGFWVNNT